jgi:two-component system nitrogen regulation response regulator GlnG/two-component system response regulator HydG
MGSAEERSMNLLFPPADTCNRRGPMSGKHDENTETEDGAGAERPRIVEPIAALTIVWSRDEADRLGESFLVPRGRPHGVSIGRGEVATLGERLLPLRQRPAGRLEAPRPLFGAKLSRDQLLVRSLGLELLVENRGRLPLARNGVPVESTSVRPGDLLELGGQLSLLCVARHLDWPALAGYPTWAFGERDPFGIVGESEATWALRRQLVATSSRFGHVLVHGPSGTGKELVAGALHTLSQRRGSFVARNAATLPESLLDAELFGNAKNYPQHGMPERPGLVGSADGGTLFLDEIGEISREAQAHLLRVLDNGEFHRLGDAAARRVDVRWVGATNRPLGELKHDVRARFPLVVAVPGLSARSEDVPLLARFLTRATYATATDAGAATEAAPSQETIRRLLRYPFTTHVRELAALLFQASDGLSVPSTDASPPSSVSPVDSSPSPGDGGFLSAGDVRATLERENWVLDRAWRALGLSSRHVLARLMKKYAIER